MDHRSHYYLEREMWDKQRYLLAEAQRIANGRLAAGNSEGPVTRIARAGAAWIGRAMVGAGSRLAALESACDGARVASPAR